jgi:DNA-3-methyladenine glycosylase II
MRGQTEPDYRLAVAALIDTDPDLARAVAAYGQPAYWHRPPGFAALVLLILEQQVSLASAAAAFHHLRTRVGEITPRSLLESSDGDLRADGFSRQKTRYARLLAEAVLTGTFDLDGLAGVSDEEARHRLVALTGIGPWTADVYLLACLRRPDLWPTADRALQVGTREVLGLPASPSPPQLEMIGARWRPHRSTAARLIWHSYLTRRGRTETVF